MSRARAQNDRIADDLGAGVAAGLLGEAAESLLDPLCRLGAVHERDVDLVELVLVDVENGAHVAAGRLARSHVQAGVLRQLPSGGAGRGVAQRCSSRRRRSRRPRAPAAIRLRHVPAAARLIRPRDSTARALPAAIPPCAGSCSRQAARCPGAPASNSGGSTLSQGSKRRGQRGWKRQPEGTAVASGQLAAEQLALAAAAGRRDRDRAHERLGVGVLGALDHVRGRALLDHPAEVHDRDPVAERPGEAEVVGDEQQRQLALPLELEQHGEDLRLHRDVEHRDRLVADQPVGLEHERRGDRHPLALAAGELVRVALAEALRIEPDVVERAAARARRARPWRRPAPAAARRRSCAPAGAG